MNKNYVYHACREQDVGDYTKGYIGVSIDPVRRERQHRNRNGSCYNLHKALDKYCDVVFNVIFEGTLEECYAYEAKLRPKVYMGWNILIGGINRPIVSMKGEDNPIYGRTGADAPMYGKKLTQEQKQKVSDFKLKNHVNSSKFKGFYITPTGKYDSVRKASKANNCSIDVIQGRCKTNKSEKWKELGWDFQPK